MGGCQNDGRFLAVHISGGIGIDVDMDTDTQVWVVVKILVHFWVRFIIRHLAFRGPKRGPQF